MRIPLALPVCIALISAATSADAADPFAESFKRIYSGICIRHIADLNVLREKLQGAPQLPPDKAALFLQGAPGTAYPVPDRSGGMFVVDLPAGKPLCALFARRVNAAEAEEGFLQFARNAPPPYVSKLLSENEVANGPNAPNKTVMYEWSAVGAVRKIVLTLTTSTSELAELQGMASVALAQ